MQTKYQIDQLVNIYQIKSFSFIYISYFSTGPSGHFCPYRLSPVQDRERRGSGGLLFRHAVHAAQRNEEDLIDGAVLENQEAGAWDVAVLRSLSERSDLSFVGTSAGGQQASRKSKQRYGRRSGQPAAEAEQPSTHSHSFPTSATFQLRVRLYSSIHVWQKEHIGSARLPQPAARARRDKAGGGGGGACVWLSLILSLLYASY